MEQILSVKLGSFVSVKTWMPMYSPYFYSWLKYLLKIKMLNYRANLYNCVRKSWSKQKIKEDMPCLL